MVNKPSGNPFIVLSRYGLDHIVSAPPETLRRDLTQTTRMLDEFVIELLPDVDSSVIDAIQSLDQFLTLLLKRSVVPGQDEALKQLRSWRKSYQRDYGHDDTITNPGLLVASGQISESLEHTTFVDDTTYLSRSRPLNAEKQLERLTPEQQKRLGLFIRTMDMYAKVPEEEGFLGIEKAIIEGKFYASLYGIDFVEVYQPQLLGIVRRFVQVCLTPMYGRDRSALSIARSGINIVDKEALFTQQVDLAARLVQGFKGSLHYHYGEEMTRAIVAYADRSYRDIGILVQQAQRESDPNLFQIKMEEARTYLESAQRVGEKYNVPIPPPQINVAHFILPPSPKPGN